MLKKIVFSLCVLCVFFGVTAFAGEYESSCPEGYKETVTKSGHGRTQCYIDTDTDTDTDTQGNFKDQEDLQVKVGVKAENIVKFSETSGVDVTYLKDINNTNSKEGHEVQAVLVKRFEGLDLSVLNPFNWFNKGDEDDINTN